MKQMPINIIFLFNFLNKKIDAKHQEIHKTFKSKYYNDFVFEYLFIYKIMIKKFLKFTFCPIIIF